MKKILLFLLFGINSVFADNNLGFLYKGEPINPGCVAMFNASIADYPYIRSINLDACQHSNAAYKKVFKDHDTYYFFQNDKDGNDGRYDYEVVGKTKNNIYILSTTSSSGGTLVASDLLFVRLTKVNEYVYTGPQLSVDKITEMRLLGYVIGGDRCIGAFAQVRVDGNRAMIKQYHEEQSGGVCERTREYSINLDKL